MKLLETYLPESLVEALGWTLLHSLWQGLLLGAILLVIFRLNRNISPRIKYGISLASLFALPLAAVITFSILYNTVETSTNLMGRLLQDTVSTAEPAIEIMAGAGMEIPLTERLAGVFDWLIPVWLLGVFLLSARLTGGLFLTARMRREGITIPDIEWLSRFESLQSRTGIKMGIRYLQSFKIQVPTVCGIFKPVILLPASMLSGLPADQIEAVIVHELAHIKRFDFLVNILQTLVEAIFFYHPVVWLISQQVRREREKCCDDFAVDICGKISIYARALAGISEMRSASPVPAVALSNNKKQIIHRVERLLKTKKMKNNANEKWVAGLIIMAAALLITVSTGAAILAVLESPLPVETPPIPAPLADSSMKYEVMDNMVENNFRDKDGNMKNMRFLIKNGEVKELYVDGERVPDDKMGDYQKETDKVLDDLADMEEDLLEAREKLEDLDIEEMREKMHQEMEYFRQHEWQAMQEELSHIYEDIKVDIDREEIQKQLQEAMDENQEWRYAFNEEEFADMERKMKEAMERVHNNMEEIHIDEEKIRESIEKSMQHLEDIDMQAIEKSIQEAMQKLQEMDFQEMEEKMRKSFENLEDQHFHIDKEKKTLDEMISELEKLELKEK